MNIRLRIARLEKQFVPTDDLHCPKCNKINLEAERQRVAEEMARFKRLSPEEQEKRLAEHRRKMENAQPPEFFQCGSQRWPWNELRALPQEELFRIHRESLRARYCTCHE
jgi:hypothetical protein